MEESISKRDFIKAQIMAVIEGVDCCPDHEPEKMADDILKIMGY